MLDQSNYRMAIAEPGFRQKFLDLVDLGERKKYAFRIFALICVWLFALFVVLFFQGFSPWDFDLTNAVLLALIAGTTISVIGIFIIVAKYLFPSNSGPI